MGVINEIIQLTHNKFVNLYNFKGESKKGKKINYFVASRRKSSEQLLINTRKNKGDGVVIYSLYEDKVVLIKQYRYTIGDYIYEFPAGLIEENEPIEETAIREMKEETGLDLKLIKNPKGWNRPFFTTVGMTDEACGTVFGYASGKITEKYQEASEEIEVVLATREMAKEILEKENVAIICAYMLMHFINSKEPFDFLKEDWNE